MSESREISNKTAKTIKRLIEAAKSLPYDQTQEIDGVKMLHVSATKLSVEHVLIFRSGVLWRSLLISGKWGRIHEIVGTI